MSGAEEEGVWLEGSGHSRTEIHGNCSFGRSAKNMVVLDSPKISRRHAIINVQNMGEFWLIDLGSSNGTFLNRRRIPQPVRLCDHDQIGIGDHTFTFRQGEQTASDHAATLAQQTVRQIENVPCWLLVADVENFTPLSRSMVAEQLATLLGGWVSSCKDIIESHDGMINKYLGDGILAYWHDRAATPEDVSQTLSALKVEQAKAKPKFRVALHFGLVAIGGVPSMGEESLMGREVNFVFRMEKLAGSLGVSCLLSAAAREQLSAVVAATSVGEYELKGFEKRHEFFRP